MNSKYCNACKRKRTRDQFGHNVARHDGLQSQCLECRAAKARERRSRDRS